MRRWLAYVSGRLYAGGDPQAEFLGVLWAVRIIYWQSVRSAASQAAANYLLNTDVFNLLIFEAAFLSFSSFVARRPIAEGAGVRVDRI